MGYRELDHELSEKCRLMVRKADWHKFDASLSGFENGDIVCESVDEEVIELTTSVLAAAELLIPRSKGKEKRTTRWTYELGLFRNHVKRARRRLQRAKDATERCSRLREYRRSRNSYFVAIKRAKKEAWEKFVKTEGAKDPWGYLIGCCQIDRKRNC